MENNYLGFPWFRKRDYVELQKIFVDNHLMPNTYEEWMDGAAEGVDRLSRDGFIVEKVIINPETFPAWCKAKGLHVDARARLEFADDFIASKYFKNFV